MIPAGICLIGAVIEIVFSKTTQTSDFIAYDFVSKNIFDNNKYENVIKKTDEFLKNSSLIEYLEMEKAKKHISELMKEASAMDDGLSVEEKAEKVKEAARRMGYDVGD